MSAAPAFRVVTPPEAADFEAKFLAAMEAGGAGMADPSRLVADNEKHRYRTVDDEPGDENGCYWLRLDERGAIGGFQNWKGGDWNNWNSQAPNARRLSAAERQALAQKRERQQRAQATKTAKKNTAAAKASVALWDAATSGETAYSKWKRVKPTHARVIPVEKAREICGPLWPRDLDHATGLLIVVPFSAKGGRIVGAQMIAEDGTKRPVTGSQLGGNLNFAGAKIEGDPEIVIIGEGWATCETVAAATGQPVVVAFDCGNLTPVAKRIRKKYPNARIIIAADNDQWTTKPVVNPGMVRSREAAEAVGNAHIVAPLDIPAEEGAPDSKGATDWNDVAGRSDLGGLDAVRDAFAAAMRDHGERRSGDVAELPCETGEAVFDTVNSAKRRRGGGGGEGPNFERGEKRKPLGNSDAWPFRVTNRGIEHRTRRENRDGETEDVWTRIAPRLDVVALCRDTESGGWGHCVEFLDPDGRKQALTLAAGDLLGSKNSSPAFQALAERGYGIPTKRAHFECFVEYVTTAAPAARRRSVDRIGWTSKGEFLLPGRPPRIYGAGDELIELRGRATTAAHRFNVSGTLVQWQAEIGELCAGNSRLGFGVCVALSAPLVRLAAGEGGGFHFVGTSSTGKSTAAHVAESVVGGDSASPALPTWRATANGLEARLAAHSDMPLVLDEIGQSLPEELGDGLYMIANGHGKGRMNADTSARPSLLWCATIISTGERTPEDVVAGSRKAKGELMAGQLLRLACIPWDAGAGMGGFERLHGFASAADLAEALRDRTRRLHGTAGDAWLAELTKRDRATLAAEIKRRRQRIRAEMLDGDQDPQSGRVAERFALAEIAGEMAIEVGILPWPKGEAARAARRCFSDWLEGRGGTMPADTRNALVKLRDHLASAAGERFDDANSDPQHQRVRNREGWYRQGRRGREFGIIPSKTATILGGLWGDGVKRDLVRLGVLIVPGGQEGKRGKTQRTIDVQDEKGGKVKQKVHLIDWSALVDATEAVS